MTKIDVFSGFLGAGKTTLIKKLIREAYAGEKLVLIENEFGEIGIDGGFLKEAGIEITEMNSGCICCSLVGDFSEALGQVLDRFAPDRIFIEPSGVGKLSDVIRAASGAVAGRAEIGSLVTVVDANKCRVYVKNFGEFFLDQLEHAGTVVLSRTGDISPEKLEQCLALIREHNPDATVVTTPWDQLTGDALRAVLEQKNTLAAALERLKDETVCPVCGHVHDHDDHDHDHDDHDDHDHHDHDHDHHDHDDHDHDGHDHDHDHHHHHDHHGHHHADEVFTSWGVETGRRFTADELRAALAALDEGSFGQVLRAKGIVPAEDGSWLHFDYVPGEIDVRTGGAEVTGRLCVIGAKIDEDGLRGLFRV